MVISSLFFYDTMRVVNCVISRRVGAPCFRSILVGLGVVDLVDRARECVNRAWMRPRAINTENAKPRDRSPSPRYYYGVRGIFESFRSTFPYKVLISILNIVALMDRYFQNRAAGRCDSVTDCDGVCDTVCTAPLIIIKNNNNKLYIYIRVRCHTVPLY